MPIRLALDARKLTDYGIGTYLTHLTEGLGARSDLELTLLVRSGHEERARALAPAARIVEVAAPGYSIAEHLRVPWALLGEGPDLIHIPHYVVPALLHRPVVVTIHDVIQLFYPPRRRYQAGIWYLRTMMKLALGRARRIITVSRASRNDLVQLFGADPDRVHVVPNGVDPALGERPPQEELDALRERYHIRSPVLLAVSNDKPHKNLDVLLRAFQLAVTRHRMPGQLVVVGGRGQDSPLALRAARLGLAERTRFVGRVPRRDLVGLYHLASVLVHVALYEGFGLPVLEAMCAGLPVVTSNVGALRELGEGVARLVDPLRAEEVAEAMNRVLVDDPLRRLMVEAGRRRAESMTWGATVEATVKVYHQAVGEVVS